MLLRWLCVQYTIEILEYWDILWHQWNNLIILMGAVQYWANSQAEPDKFWNYSGHLFQGEWVFSMTEQGATLQKDIFYDRASCNIEPTLPVLANQYPSGLEWGRGVKIQMVGDLQTTLLFSVYDHHVRIQIWSGEVKRSTFIFHLHTLVLCTQCQIHCLRQWRHLIEKNLIPEKSFILDCIPQCISSVWIPKKRNLPREYIL